jgi:chromosome segregation protein
MYLKRLDIQGFKTFATRTVFEFRPGVTAVVGPNGSGKCVVGESRVTLADGQEIQISELVNDALNTSATVELLDDGWLTRENTQNRAILSLNPKTFRLEVRPIAAFIKREAPASLLRIVTRSGRTITATHYHPLFTLEGGSLRALRADEIQVGARIAVARQLPTHSPNLQFVGAKSVALDGLRDLTSSENPNFDLVPGVTPLVREAARLAKMSVKKHRAGRSKLAAYVEGRCEASRPGLREVCGYITELGETPDAAEPLIKHLEVLAASDVYWDEVIAVEAIAPQDPWVYDLSVAETHNFVAENIIVHNSNVSDAVRWVLGEQSLATLRCKRTEELLFAGGPRRPPAGFAEVSLTIDNTDRLLPVPFDEVTLTRRATRAGDNEYFINRAKVRLRDLQEAVEPLGGSYTIVNQGLVDAALTLRPEERRRLFEDAAEIGGFEVRKSEAERRLRETDANLQRLGDLLSEIEPRLRVLKRQATQARQHAELSAELHALQRRYYGQQWATALRLLAYAEQTLGQLERELAQARVHQTQSGQALQQLRETLRERREQLGALHQASAALHARAETAQRELAISGERLASIARRAEDLVRARQELELRQTDAARELALAAATVSSAEAELAAARERLTALEAEQAAAEASRRLAERELRTAEDAALKAATADAEGRSRQQQLQTQRERTLRDRAELDTALAQAEERLGQAKAQHEQSQAALASAEAAAHEAAEAEQQARAALEAARNERSALDEERAAARRALADAEAQLDSLNRLARSYAGTFAGVRAAMQWAERTNRPGFALVSSIIRTPPELETAIEVALGSRLQNIVVERWDDAEAAIAELRRSGAGRATFLPLDTIKRQEAGGRRQEGGFDAENDEGSAQPASRLLPPVYGIAADLVAYDAPYAAVVRQLLGRVLVVADMQTARAELRKLSGGWTIVTLGGEQISSGGAVTGGAQTKESGTLRRERELRELPTKIAEARSQLERIEERRNALEGQIGKLAQAVREGEQRSRETVRAREAARGALDGAVRRLAGAEQERNWQISRHTRIATELSALDAQEQGAAQARAEAEARLAVANARLAELRTQRDAEREAGRAMSERLAELRGAASGAEAQLKASRSLLAAHTQTVERLTAQAANLTNDEANLQGEEQRLRSGRESLEQQHQQLLREIDTLRARIDPAEVELKAHESNLVTLEQAEQQATADLLAREAAYNQASLEAQRANDRRESIIERAASDGIDVNALVDEDQPSPQPAPDGRERVGGEGAQATITDSQLPGRLSAEIETLKTRILRLGAVNPLALEEYEAEAERQTYLTAQLSDLRQAEATLRELIVELEEAMRSRFTTTFAAVAAEFERSFPRLFGGGAASLQLVGGEQNGEVGESSAKTYGVDIVARPPGKRAQNISLLSGGERALTAAALLFAILTVNPSPFCILDEVDAALDESNVGRFREALAALTDRTQFIIVTHNRGTIEAADTLYGVTMGDDGASKILSLRVEEFAEAD